MVGSDGGPAEVVIREGWGSEAAMGDGDRRFGRQLRRGRSRASSSSLIIRTVRPYCRKPHERTRVR